ncbi:MAG: hypothetical protein Fur0025_23120 [Oscillatoriaceae cyanobacterium]
MTWRGFYGELVLTGEFAKLYIQAVQHGVDLLWEHCENDPDPQWYLTGCLLFDNAHHYQKVYLINICLSALIDPNYPNWKVKPIPAKTFFSGRC